MLPQILRDLSILLLYMERLAAEFTSLADTPPTSFPTFGDLAINAEDLDPFVSTAITS